MDKVFDKPVNTALAAFGMSGEVFHGPLLTAHPGFCLTTVLERRNEKAKERYPVKVVQDYDSLLSDPEIELVVVNTPDHLHYRMTREALLAGKHVVVEKPFTLNTSEANELIDLSRTQGLMLSVFHNRRFDSDFLTVRKVIESGILGHLVEFESHFDRYRPQPNLSTWKENGTVETGTIYNLGSHMVDQILVLFGMPVWVAADVRTLRPEGRVDDSYSIVFGYEGLKVSTHASYLRRVPGPKYSLHGTKGSFHKHGQDIQEQALKDGKLPEGKFWGVEPGPSTSYIDTEVLGLHIVGSVDTLPGAYPEFYNNVYEVLRHGALLDVTAEQARDVIRVIEAALESARTGKQIFVV